MIKKTFKKASPNSDSLDRSLLCQTSYLPVLDHQRSSFEQSIGYSEQVLLPNASNLIKHQQEKDRQYLNKQTKKQQIEDKEEQIESESINQFLSVRKVEIAVKKQSSSKEADRKQQFKPSKWPKPAPVPEAKPKPSVLQKKFQSSNGDNEEQIPDESNNFSQIEKAVESEHLKEEESLLISQSRPDEPNAFAFDKEMMSQYMQSGDYERQLMLRNKDGDVNMKAQSSQQMQNQVEDSQGEEEVQEEQGQQQQQQQEGEQQEQQEEQEQEEEDSEEQQQEEEEEEQEGEEEGEEEQQDQQVSGDEEEEQEQQQQQEESQKKQQQPSSSLVEVYAIQIIREAADPDPAQGLKFKHQQKSIKVQQIPDESMGESEVYDCKKYLGQQESWALAQKTISDLKSLIL